MKIYARELEYNIPESWAALTQVQQMMAVQILTTPTYLDAESDLAFKRIELWKVVSGMVQAGLDLWREDYIGEDPENGEMAFYSELGVKVEAATGFFFEDEGAGAFSIALQLLKCPLPTFSLWTTTEGSYWSAHGRLQTDIMPPIQKSKVLADRFSQKAKATQAWKTPTMVYYGPDDRMDNLDFWEMIQLFNAVERFQKDGKRTHVYQLLALLYRPLLVIQGLDSPTQRVPLIDYEAMSIKNIDLVARIPEIVINLFWFWACSCRDGYIKAYPSVFTPKSDSKVSKELERYKWAGVLMEMAGNDVTKHELVKRMNAHDVLAQFSYNEDKHSS